MYSLVLAAMLTAGADAPAWGRGCCGGCCGGCYGCYGGCRGGWGCCGCYGGCCGCYGGGCYGCYGGGCYGCGGGYAYGCYGGCYGGGCYGCYGGMVAAPVVTQPAQMAATSTSQATVVVQVPADAQLYVDGYRVKQTSSTRTFITPDLEPGTRYYYTVKAQVMRDGKSVEDTKRVYVRAGQTSQVSFSDLGAATAAAPLDGGVPARATAQR